MQQEAGAGGRRQHQSVQQEDGAGGRTQHPGVQQADDASGRAPHQGAAAGRMVLAVTHSIEVFALNRVSDTTMG